MRQVTAGAQAMSAVDRVERWSEALFEELLPDQDVPGVPVLLACDDETVRAAAEAAGFDLPDPSRAFALDVAIAFQVTAGAGWKRVVAGSWAIAAKPRPRPPFFPVLCLWALAASRMRHDEKHTTAEYHGRLCGLIGVKGDYSLPCFDLISLRFPELAQWLEADLAGKRGHLLVPQKPTPAYVGYAVEQTVFRLRDHEVLSQFFVERMPTLGGFDPLRRLRRWGGRHQLTGHARRLLEDPQVEERVRAALRAAFRVSGGAELVRTPTGFGRVWPATIHLLPRPSPRLHVGAANTKPLLLAIDGDDVVLEPGYEIELPWTMLDGLRRRTKLLGDIAAPGGALRLPQIGETAIFELGEMGLVRIEQPSAETVWVLTRDGALQLRLEQRRFNDRDALPEWWQLFRDVPVAERPEIECAPAPRTQEPFRLIGGLPLAPSTYLSGFGPLLEAGDLELDEARLPVVVNGSEIGSIGSGERLQLPSEAPDRYEVVVGGGEYHESYDVEPAGRQEAVGSLGWRLEGPLALRSGARPLDGADGVTVCGGAVSLPYEGVLPLLTRAETELVTIDERGELARHERPPTPAWYTTVDFDEHGRWEIFRAGVVWVITPKPRAGRPRVQLRQPAAPTRLSAEAAALVRALGEAVAVSGHGLDSETARRAWEEQLGLARSQT